MKHIITVLQHPAERDSGFIALGEMAGALDGELVHYLPTITSHLREAVRYCWLISACAWLLFSFSCPFMLILINALFVISSLIIHLIICRLLPAEVNLHWRHWLALEILRRPWVQPWNLMFVVF